MVLCFHAASESWRHALSLAPSEIVEHVENLVRNGVRPASLVDAARDDDTLHVTFDDAFRSATIVLPALERLAVPTTVFVCSRLANTGAPLAVRELGAEPLDERRTLEWDELEELSKRGIDVESHTLTHPHLPQLGDAELQRELAGSKQQLEERLRRRCRFLAYPFGDHDERVRRAAAEAGYEAAFAVDGTALAGDSFALPRVGVYRAPSEDSGARTENQLG